MNEKIENALDVIESEIELKINLLKNIDINELRGKQKQIEELEKIIDNLYKIGMQNHATGPQREKDQLEREVEEYQEAYHDLTDLYEQLKPLTEMLNEKLGNKCKPRKAGKRGRKGYNNLEHYLLPAIKLINNGNEYKSAFHQIAKHLEVEYNTVNAQCTRRLGLKTDEFISHVENGEIIRLLKEKFPGKSELIEQELRKYYP